MKAAAVQKSQSAVPVESVTASPTASLQEESADGQSGGMRKMVAYMLTIPPLLLLLC